MANWFIKGCSTSVVGQIHIENTKWCSFHLRGAFNNSNRGRKCWWGCGAWENLHLYGGKVNSYSHPEKQDGGLKSWITVSFTKLTSGLMSRRNGSRPLKSHLNSHVHCTAICNSHGAETSCVHYVKNFQREWDIHKEQYCSGTKNARFSKVT